MSITREKINAAVNSGKGLHVSFSSSSFDHMPDIRTPRKQIMKGAIWSHIAENIEADESYKFVNSLIQFVDRLSNQPVYFNKINELFVVFQRGTSKPHKAFFLNSIDPVTPMYAVATVFRKPLGGYFFKTHTRKVNSIVAADQAHEDYANQAVNQQHQADLRIAMQAMLDDN